LHEPSFVVEGMFSLLDLQQLIAYQRSARQRAGVCDCWLANQPVGWGAVATVVFMNSLTSCRGPVCTIAIICRKYNVDVVELLLDKKNIFPRLAKRPEL
jgi:hypothetical protein